MDPLEAFIAARAVTRRTVEPDSAAATELDHLTAMCTDRLKDRMTVDAQWDFFKPYLIALLQVAGEQLEVGHRRAMRAIFITALVSLSMIAMTVVLIYLLRDHLQLANIAMIVGGFGVLCSFLAFLRLVPDSEESEPTWYATLRSNLASPPPPAASMSATSAST